MTLESLIKSELWQEFERKVRSKRRQPAKVLAELLREYLEIQEDIALTEAMRRSARKSGYRESDAVKIVREYRNEKKNRRAVS
ncbi:MAG TPA: hypothetical protein VGQ39_07110 [Pyrinomonadaceae bacterium]|jgi:hypothetical protein|nr:hypothetical protein [Pyrinomonadaceae bacterium]